MDVRKLTPAEYKILESAHNLKEYCKNQVCTECLLRCYISECRINTCEDPERWELPALRATHLDGVPEVKNDNVNHPAHYTAGGVECIDAIEAATVNLTGIEAVCTGNVIKYSWRWKLKNGVEDLKKAAWYLMKLIKRLDPNWRAE